MSRSDRPFRVSFFNSGTNLKKVTLQKTSSTLEVKKEKEEEIRKVSIVKSNSEPIDVGLNESSTTLEVKTGVNEPVEDVYYDEIIIYDGGGVDGYEKEMQTCQGDNTI